VATPPQSDCCNEGPKDLESNVIERYARGAEQVQPALCCPTEGYDAELLKILPKEILEKDYGCGDPSRWAQQGDVVVDLGSGQGKICYILSQKVGAEGRVIGVDFNNAMLNLARKYEDEMAQKIGYHNTRFAKGRIQDLALDLDVADAWLQDHPISSMHDMAAYDAECERLRSAEPMIRSDSVDLVVSNCVLNLVKPEDKTHLFDEIFRVLREGGRAVISDIVCDTQPPAHMAADPDLWSGCISGAFQEDRFIEMFKAAGFQDVELLARAEEPWQVVEGIEFRSVTVRAHKGKTTDTIDPAEGNACCGTSCC
jgi:arsenite methyltransferase